MLQFDVALCRARDNGAHKVQRYIRFFVASELVSDVERFVADRVHVARTNNNQVRLRRIPLSSPKQALGYKAEALYGEDRRTRQEAIL